MIQGPSACDLEMQGQQIIPRKNPLPQTFSQQGLMRTLTGLWGSTKLHSASPKGVSTCNKGSGDCYLRPSPATPYG